MFGIGMPELILILVIALLVFGPKKLPEISKALGKGMHELKKAGDDLKDTWEKEMRAQMEEEEGSIKAAQGVSLAPGEAPSRSGYPQEEVYGGPSLAYPGEEELLQPPPSEPEGESPAPSALTYPSEEELAQPAHPQKAEGEEGSSKTHG